MTRAFPFINGGPNGIRTRVTDVRGQCPRPLDDGTPYNGSIINKQWPILNEHIIMLSGFCQLEFSHCLRMKALFKLTYTPLKIKR